MRIREKFLHSLFNRWGFLRPPEMPLDEAMYLDFKQLWRSIGTDSKLGYDLPYKKAYFFRWLTQEKGVLLHGSNRAGIEELSPRKQTNFKGQAVEGVFTSSDGLWPIYFAVLNYQNPNLWATRNGCFSIGEERFYLFCVNQEAFQESLWTDGWIYILPSDGFVSQDPGGMWQSEWISQQRVKPLACLPVSYRDFPYWQHVVGFPKGEHMLLTWSRYGKRIGK